MREGPSFMCRKPGHWTGQMTQWVRFLPRKHKNVSWNPETYVKILLAHTCIHSTGRPTYITVGPAKPAKPEALGLVENPVSKNQGGELPRDSLCSHHHMDTHTCTCIYTPKGKWSTALGYGAWVLSNPHPPPASVSGTTSHR